MTAIRNDVPTGSPNSEKFFARTRDARKVMVLDLGFLGDTVHTLPALWMIRQAYPKAELHMAVSEHVTSLLQCVPWLNHVWGYPRFPRHATLTENLRFVSRLRRERFDVLINLNGSDRSSWLTLFSGASERLGRLRRPVPPPLWSLKFTDFVRYSSLSESSYLQKCKCLQRAGFPLSEPEFHIEIKKQHLEATGVMPADSGAYIHISPFTTADNKELSPTQLVELIGLLRKHFPEKRLILSAAPTQREQEKLAALLSMLTCKPWRVFCGNLTLMQLAAIIQHSAIHLCGDTGTLHLALMTGAKAVSWFRPNPGMQAWIPVGDKYQTFVGTTSETAQYLNGISSDELIRSIHTVLDKFCDFVIQSQPASCAPGGDAR